MRDEQGRLRRRAGRGRDPGRRLRARRPRRRRGRDPRARAGRRRDAHVRAQGRDRPPDAVHGRRQPAARARRAAAAGQPARPAIHPRTAIGFKDGGRTLLLVTADGRQDPVLGVSLRRLARFMADLGAETALNLDGGGSTTMVARPLGEDKVTVRNSPSDGSRAPRPERRRRLRRRRAAAWPTSWSLTPGGAARVPGPAPHAEGQGDRRPRHAGGDARDVTWTGATNGRVAAPAGRLRQADGPRRGRRRERRDRGARARQARHARAVVRAPGVRRRRSLRRARAARDRPRRRGLHGPARARRPRARLRPLAARHRAGRDRPAADAEGRGRHDARRPGGGQGRQAADHDRRQHRERLHVRPRRRADALEPERHRAGHAAALDAGRPPEAHLPGPPQHGHHLADRRDAAGGAGRAAAHPRAAVVAERARVLQHHLRRRRRHQPQPARLADPPGLEHLRVDAPGRRRGSRSASPRSRSSRPTSPGRPTAR